MMTSKRNQMITGVIWLFTFLITAYIAYFYFPVSEIDWFYVLFLFLIICIVMLLPIKAGGVSITLERWITIAIFLQYGLFAEFVLIQFAMFILLFSGKTSLPLTHKFFMNSIIFSVTSLVSAFAFVMLGGEIQSHDFLHVVIYSFLYGIVYALVNNVLLKLYFRLDGQPFSIFSKGVFWDYLSTLIMIPMGVALYFLNNFIGAKSLLLIGVPLLVMLIVIRRYIESNTRQHQLTYATEIGRELANKVLFDEVLETYLEKLTSIIPFENGYVVDYRSEKSLFPLMSIEGGAIYQQVTSIEFIEDKEEGDGLDLQKTKIYTGPKELARLKNIVFKEKMNTVMSIPIIREERTEGFLLLTSKQKNAFHHEDIQILEVLTGYFGVSLEKATLFERTLNQSKRCGLTGLHNYRYLDQTLEAFVASYYAGEIECLSVVILDIDYFKKVNDAYGHENGNVVLVKLARILEKYRKENDVLARYGGEEFVFLFPDTSKEDAIIIAEAIRKEVERTPFTIISDLDESQQSFDLHITISLGVATLPVDALVGSDLIRNADRALYIDGKQAGRNRVGVFGRQLKS